MKKLALIILFVSSCAFSQVVHVPIQQSVPDSVIVARMAEIVAEFNKNADTIRKLQERQVFLNGQHIALSDLRKEDDTRTTE